MTSPYHFYERRALNEVDQSSSQQVEMVEVELLDAEFTARVAVGQPFVARLEGAATIDVDTTTGYDVTLVTRHVIGGVSFDIERTRSRRLSRQGSESVSLSEFNSDSQVGLGEYTAAGGETVDVTADLVDSDCRIVLLLRLAASDGRRFGPESVTVAGGEAVWWQLADIPAELPPTDGSVDLDALADAVAQRLAPAPTPATRGRFVRQADAGERLVFGDAPAGGGDAVDAYASVADYRARTGAAAAAVPDETVAAALEASARMIDRRLGWAPGALGPLSGERTVRFWPGRTPGRVLWMRDAEGHAWPLRGWTSIACDYSGRGRPDTVIAAGAAWVAGLGSGGRPWRALRILEAHVDAAESVWPTDPGSVTVVSSQWGHAATVPAAVDLVVHTARAILDGEAAGAAATVRAFDAAVSVDPQASRLWRTLEMEFSAGRPGRLGVLSSAAGRP